MLKRWCLAAFLLMLAGLLMKPAAVAAESARSFRQQNGLMAYACYRTGIGLTAMKIQGGGPVQSYSESALEMAGRFMQKGSTDHQAKLMVVWEDKRIAGICSQMPNLTIMAQTRRRQSTKSAFRRQIVPCWPDTPGKPAATTAPAAAVSARM